jgi:lysophospholipase
MGNLQNLTMIVTLATAACIPAQVNGTTASYDGTASAFGSFAADQQQDWPVPAEIDWFKAPDGKPLRYAHWAPPGEPIGTVIFFQGRTEFIEKNIYTYMDLRNAGYDVWTLDWRGQGLSHRPLGGTDKGYIDSYDTFVADARHFIDTKVSFNKEKPRILLAHSMGGGIGTLYLMRHPTQFDQAVFSSPLIRLPANQDNPPVRIANRGKVLAGLGGSCAGANPFCSWASSFADKVDPCTFRGAVPSNANLRDAADTWRYTHDFAKVALFDCMVIRSQDTAEPDPGLAVGGATSSWLRATFLATDEIAANPARLKTPLLIIGAGGDTVVSNEGQSAFCGESNSSCCRIEIAGAGHEILIEAEDKRQAFMDHFQQFVSRPLQQTPKDFCKSFEKKD